MASKSPTPRKLQEALIRLIWSQSYSHVTIDAICEEAQVNKGSFYHFYKSKSSLALEAFDWHWEHFSKPRLDDIFSASRSPQERLEMWLHSGMEITLAQQQEHGRVLGCPFFNIGQETASVEPEVSAKTNEMLGRYVRYITSAIRDAQTECLTDINNPERVARSIFILLEGSVTQARIQNSLAPLEDLPEAVGRLAGLTLQPHPALSTSA